MRRYLCVALLSVSVIHYSLATDHNLLKEKHQVYLKPGDTTKKATDTASDDDVKVRIFKISVEGASDQTNHGLHNAATKLPYLEPSFTYMAKSGFFIGTSDQFLLVKKDGGFDVLGINPGWDVDITDNTSFDFNYQYYHFKAKTPDLVRSSLNSDIESYISQDLGDFTGKLTVDYDIYSAIKGQPKTPNDFVFTPDIRYFFDKHFGKKSAIIIMPEVSLDLGTRNFYTQYENNTITDSNTNNLKVKRKLLAGNSNSSFGALDYNLILTLKYKIGKFDIKPAFTYTDPLYKTPGTSNSPTAFGTISLDYLIESKK